MMRPLRLAYLTSAYARASDSFIRGEVAAQRALGHNVRTFSIRRPAGAEIVGEEIRRERDATVDLLAVGLHRLGWAAVREALSRPRAFGSTVRITQKFGTPGLKGRLWPQAYLLEAAYLAHRLRAERIEHLHNHIGEGSAAVAALAAELAGIPFSITVHGPNEFDRPELLALGEKVKRSAFTVTVSDYGRGQLSRWCDPADWSKIHVVRCGVDASFLQHQISPITAAPRLVCIGRLAEQKGQIILVDAAARLVAEGRALDVAIIGDGPMRLALEARIREHRLQKHVRLVGWKTSEAVRAEIVGARAVVLPSFAEGLPVVLMEALALGRPAISTFVAGIPELIEPGASGWLVPPASVDALADAMREAVTMPPERLLRMGRAGQARVAERHDARASAQRLADLFYETQSSRARSPSALANVPPTKSHKTTSHAAAV